MEDKIVYVPVSVELLQNLIDNSWDLRNEWQWKAGSVKKSYNREMEGLSKDIAEAESILQNPTPLSELLKEKDEQIKELVLALIKLTEGYEQWEADIITNNVFWWPHAEKDALSGKLYDDMLLLQEHRNEAKSILQKHNAATKQ